MKTKMKALTLVLCAVMLVATTVFATVAFLTSTDSVENTFTVGKVVITLDEADVDKNGVVEAGEDRTSTEGRVQENEYHLIPAHTYVKDPTIHVDEDSENCLLFVKLVNGLKDIIADTTIEDQMIGNDWTLIDATNNIWAYTKVVAASSHIDVFDDFKLKDDADVSIYATEKDADGKVTNNAVISVTAYALQADGFVANTTKDAAVTETDASAAWNKAFANNN